MILAIFKGLRKGFILGIFSLLAFIIGLAAALKLSAVVAVYLQKSSNASRWLPVLSFILCFYCGISNCWLGARLIKKTLILQCLDGSTDWEGWFCILLFIRLYSALFYFLLKSSFS